MTGCGVTPLSPQAMLPLAESGHSPEKFRAISRAQLLFQKAAGVRAGEDRSGEHPLDGKKK
jgi:hypothetical protein